MDGPNKELLTRCLLFIIIFQNKHKITLQLLLTMYNGNILWVWNRKKPNKIYILYEKERENVGVSYADREKNGKTTGKRTVGPQGEKTSLLFGLYYNVKIGIHN